MTDPIPFATWLKRRRRALEFTQAQLAQAAHCAAITIKRIEAGDLRPSVDLAAVIARVLEVPEAEHGAFVAFARDGQSLAPAEAFAPAPSLTPAHTPPSPLNAFFGRERELSAAVRILRQPAARLLTLSGPPGSGKTRLGLALASELQADYSDGVVFVPLTPVQEAARVPAAIASALNLRDAQDRPLVNVLRDVLRRRRTLLLLDNFEQVLDARQVVVDLLTAAPGLKVLITSRERLDVYGEREYPVPPLEVPDTKRLPPPEALMHYPAVQLFADRAQAVNAEFSLDEASAPLVARICGWLDGLPLAIELAAAQVRQYTLDQIASQLDQTLHALTGGPLDVSPRQQTLLGALEWSYRLLTADEQQVARHVSVLRGEFTGQLAVKVSGLEPDRAQRALVGLVRKNLITRRRDDGRYASFEIVRAFAAEQLERSAEAWAAHWRLAQAVFAHTDEAHRAFLRGDRDAWLRLVEPDAEALRTALAWLLAPGDEFTQRTELALELSLRAYDYWRWRGHWAEDLAWLSAVLEPGNRATGEPATGNNTLLARVAELAVVQVGMIVDLRRRGGEQAQIIRGLAAYGYALAEAGRHAEAEAVLAEGRALAERDPAHDGLAFVLNSLGGSLALAGRWAEARTTLLAARDVNKRWGQVYRLSYIAWNLALAERMLGNADEARAELRTCLALAEEIGDVPYFVQAVTALAQDPAVPDRVALLDHAVLWLTGHPTGVDPVTIDQLQALRQTLDS